VWKVVETYWTGSNGTSSCQSLNRAVWLNPTQSFATIFTWRREGIDLPKRFVLPCSSEWWKECRNVVIVRKNSVRWNFAIVYLKIISLYPKGIRAFKKREKAVWYECTETAVWYWLYRDSGLILTVPRQQLYNDCTETAVWYWLYSDSSYILTVQRQ
jgi:hypothetical protein